MIELFTNYELLKITWWMLIGVLLIGFSITGGYDLGSAGLLTLIGQNNTERRVIINAVAPHWDGNQVWFITAGGAIFAAWPIVYATAFSGFYWAMMLVLLALMLRPLAFEYRAKVDDAQKKWCDIALVISGLVPALIFGVAFGNLFQGYGFDMDNYLRTSFQANFFSLLNPFGILCGIVSLSMILMQGASWLNLRTAGSVQIRAAGVARIMGIVVLVTFALGGLCLTQMPGYVITSVIDMAGSANPMNKTVAFGEAGAWLSNFGIYSWMILAPVLGFTGAGSVVYLNGRIPALGFLCSSLSNAGIIMTAGFSLFPFILPSSTNPNVSLTVWDATSSELTLGIMTFVAMVFVPLILGYTTWCFYKMWGKVDSQHIETNTHSLY